MQPAADTMNHGVPRAAAGQQDRSAQARERELKEIESYKALINDVNEGVRPVEMKESR